MGYYTDFKLDYDSNIDNEVIAEELSKISCYSFDSSLELYAVKWYMWNKDMEALSEMYPETLFTLTGTGEEKDDMWRSYYKNGKSQFVKARIAFDPFDESKMEC